MGRGLQRRRPAARAARGRPRAAGPRVPRGRPLAADVDGLEGELAAAGSPIVSIGPGRELAAAEGLCEELAPIALIVPAQLVAERLALLRGRDPDRPPASRRSRAQ